MFKKAILILISVILLISCSACGNKINDEESVSIKEKNDSEFKLNAVPLSKKLVFEKDGIKVTLDEILYEDVTTKIVYKIDNKTDKNVKILATDLAVNSIMCTDTLMTEVSSKTEKEAYIEISNEWFINLHISAIKDLEYVIRVLDEEENEILRSDILKANTNAPVSYSQQYSEDGFEIYKENGIVFLANELKNSKLSNDLELSFYVENNTNGQFSIVAQNVKINGKDIAPTFLITVGANKKAVDSMLFEKTKLTQIGVEEIKTIEASFKAFNDSLETVFETNSVQIPVK